MDRPILIRISYTKKLTYGEVTVKSLFLRGEYRKGVFGRLAACAVDDVLYAVTQDLKREAEAEKDVVRGAELQRPVELEDPLPRATELPPRVLPEAPFERIESLRPALRFRVPLEGDDTGKVRFESTLAG
jgi:hypothetical protein